LQAELSRQLDTGRVEVCDLPAITTKLDAASAAINRYLAFERWRPESRPKTGSSQSRV